jgi:hypothetical protein
MSWSIAAALLLAAQDLPSRSLSAHGQGTTQVRSTADGKLLLTTGVPDRTVKVWLLSTGKVLHTLARQAECFAIRPDGGLAAVGEAEGTTVWNLTTGQSVHSLAAGRTIALGWSADGKALTTVGSRASGESPACSRSDLGLPRRGDAEAGAGPALAHAVERRDLAGRNAARRPPLGRRPARVGSREGPASCSSRREAR